MNRDVHTSFGLDTLNGANCIRGLIAVGSGMAKSDNSIDIFTGLGNLVNGYKPIFIFVFTKSKIEQELCHLVRKRALS